MDNFNLKKYLVENKVTTNSRMIKENEEDFSVELLVPTIYRNGETGELAKTPAAFGARSELKNMDITNYSDGEELIEWVFDGSLEKAKYFEKEYPGLFKVVGVSKMINEEGTLNFEEEAHQFPELVAKYGIQAVADALEAIYINAEDASEEAGVDADTLYLNQVDSFKEDPSDLVATVEDSL